MHVKKTHKNHSEKMGGNWTKCLNKLGEERNVLTLPGCATSPLWFDCPLEILYTVLCKLYIHLLFVIANPIALLCKFIMQTLFFLQV